MDDLCNFGFFAARTHFLGCSDSRRTPNIRTAHFTTSREYGGTIKAKRFMLAGTTRNQGVAAVLW